MNRQQARITLSASAHPQHRLSRFPHRSSLGMAAGVWTVLSLTGCSVVTAMITPAEQEKLVKQDEALLFKDVPPVSGPLTLHEAMARALKYNMDYRLKRLEEVLAWKQEDVARLEMLPNLALAAGYSGRSPENASVSRSLYSGTVSTEPTLSRESATGTADFTMSWNLLDFGVSYYQTRQEGNKRLIQSEQRRKTAHNLLKDVRFAFWRAAAAQWLEQEISIVQKASMEAVELARKVEREGLRSPVPALQFQLGLLEITRQLEKSRAELAMAKDELATLIHLEPGVALQLVDDGSVQGEPLELVAPIEELERWALTFRPELRIEQYQARIEADETRKAIARLFPGLEFNVSENADSSALLVYQHWAQAGARLSWNLLRALNGSTQLDLADSREKVVQMRRLVMHMAVLGQTRIAYHEYRAAREGLRRIMVENETRKRLQDHTANRSGSGLDSQLSYVHTVAAAALGRVGQYEAFARYQSALGRLYASLGWDPLGEEGVGRDVPALTRLLRENDGQWQKKVFASRNPLPFIDAKTMLPLPLEELLAEQLDAPIPAKPLQHAPLPGPVNHPEPRTADRVPAGSTPIIRYLGPASAAEVARSVDVTEIPNREVSSHILPLVAPRSRTRHVLPLQRKPEAHLGKTRYAVQVASAMDPSGVEKLVASLRVKGYPLQVHSARDAEGRSVNQVWIGVFDSNADAQTARKVFQEREGQPGFIKVITD
ncbi:MAG: TolC family protein [Magnetococcales bacterium]|nr:TolC family protein [Magnetococcales bacterium]